MKIQRIPLLALALACVCAIALTGCSTPGKKSKPKPKTIDRKGIQAVAILGGYLFPRAWDEKTDVSMARRIYPLEYHGDTYQGKTLIQSKVQMDSGALQRLLTDAQRTSPTFTTDTDVEHPFGKDSHQTVDNKGTQRQLSWWKPGKHKHPKYYYWSTNYPNEPVTRIWLQSTDEEKNVRLLYIRIESENIISAAPAVQPAPAGQGSSSNE